MPRLEVTDIDGLAYKDTELITAVKSFVSQAPGVCTIKTLQNRNAQIP